MLSILFVSIRRHGKSKHHYLLHFIEMNIKLIGVQLSLESDGNNIDVVDSKTWQFRPNGKPCYGLQERNLSRELK